MCEDPLFKSFFFLFFLKNEDSLVRFAMGVCFPHCIMPQSFLLPGVLSDKNGSSLLCFPSAELTDVYLTANL